MNPETITTSFGRCSVVRRFCVLLASAGVLLLTTAAFGGCGSHAASGPAMNAQVLSLANLLPQASGNNSIVGLWHVTYTAGGQLFYEAFDTWHSDGTEIESANFDPTEGNQCMGVWKQVDSTIHLYHVGWLFDSVGNSMGLFTLTERNVLAGNGNSYRGTFDYKAYDPNGNLVQEITGTLAATRIGVN